MGGLAFVIIILAVVIVVILKRNKSSGEPLKGAATIGNAAVVQVDPGEPSPHRINIHDSAKATPFSSLPEQNTSTSEDRATNDFLYNDRPSEVDRPSSNLGRGARVSPEPSPNRIPIKTVSGLKRSMFSDEGGIGSSNPNREFEMDMRDITIGGRLGKGSYGEVKKGRWRNTDVAVKVTPPHNRH